MSFRKPLNLGIAAERQSRIHSTFKACAPAEEAVLEHHLLALSMARERQARMRSTFQHSSPAVLAVLETTRDWRSQRAPRRSPPARWPLVVAATLMGLGGAAFAIETGLLAHLWPSSNMHEPALMTSPPTRQTPVSASAPGVKGHPPHQEAVVETSLDETTVSSNGARTPQEQTIGTPNGATGFGNPQGSGDASMAAKRSRARWSRLNDALARGDLGAASQEAARIEGEANDEAERDAALLLRLQLRLRTPGGDVRAPSSSERATLEHLAVQGSSAGVRTSARRLLDRSEQSITEERSIRGPAGTKQEKGNQRR